MRVPILRIGEGGESQGRRDRWSQTAEVGFRDAGVETGT